MLDAMLLAEINCKTMKTMASGGLRRRQAKGALQGQEIDYRHR
jgi:hypothetical protein